MRETSSASHRFLTLIVWSVVTLSTIGVAGALIRALHVARTLDGPDQRHSALSPLDQRNLQLVADTRNLKPGTKAYQDFEAETVSSFAKFTVHPLATFLHIVPGCLLLILGPLQFSSRIRTRHLRYHRWAGRVLLLAAVPAGLSALFFGLLSTAAVPSASLVFGGFFLFAATRAFICVRRHDIIHHREWMIRTFAVAIGISTVRIVGGALFILTRADPHQVIGLSFWIGELLTLAVAELWIRDTRHTDRLVPELAPAAASRPDPA